MKDLLGISPLVYLICFVWFSLHKIYQLKNHLSSVKCQVASHCTHETVPRLPTQNHAFELSSMRELVYSSTEPSLACSPVAAAQNAFSFNNAVATRSTQWTFIILLVV